MQRKDKADGKIGAAGLRASRFRASRGRLLCAALFLSLAAACSSPEEKVAKYTTSGEEFLEQGDLGRANIQFQNALKIDEEHVPALVGLAEVAEQKQDFKNMFGLLQRVVRLQPENLDAHVKLGKLYLIASDETSSLDHAEKALAIAPDDINALSLKAAVQLKLGDTAGAVELATRVIAKDPANPEAVTVLATERTLAGEYEEALAELDRALEIKPDIAVLQLLRISVLTRLGRTDDVRAAYANLIELFPEEAAYRRVYTTDLIQRGEYDAAEEQLEKIAELEPDSLNAKLDIIRVLMKGKSTDAATAKMRSYVDAEPDNIQLKFAYIDFLRQTGDDAGVRKALTELSRSSDTDVALQAKNKLAGDYLRNDDRATAEALINEILAADERNTDALIKRAGLFVSDEKYDEAVLDLRTALDNNPDSAEAMVLMAMAFERQSNPSFAQAEFAKAFDASGKDEKIGNAFARFQLRQKNPKRAEEILVDSLAANPGDLENLKLLAAIRLSRQDWRGAEEVGEIIDRLENQDELAESIKSAAYAGLGDYNKIIETLKSDADDAPLASRPLATLVAAYLRSDRADEAEALLQRVLSSGDENYAAYILLAQVYGAKQDEAKAEETLLAAKERDPSRSEAYELLYRYYLRTGQSQKAAVLIEDGLAKNPDNEALRVFKADTFISAGRLEEALAIYEDVLKDNPENRIVANNFVSLTSDLRQDAASIARALEVSKVLEGEDNPYFLDTVGWAHYRAGDFDKAVEFLSIASEGAGQNPEIAYHLGAAYFAAGDREKAKAMLEKSLATGGDGFRYADEIRQMLGRI